MIFYFPANAPKNEAANAPPIRVNVRVCIAKPELTISEIISTTRLNRKATPKAFIKTLCSLVFETPYEPIKTPIAEAQKTTILAAASDIRLK